MNEGARRALFSLHHRAIRRFIRRLVPSGAAEDLVQDVAVVLFSHNSGPPDSESFVGWCCVVAQHVAAHRRRSEARAYACYERLSFQRGTSPMTCSDSDPEQAAATRELLATRFDRLDAQAVELLRDRFVLEETATEMAVRLNVSAASVRMRVARLVVTLRTMDHKSSKKRKNGSYVRSPSGKKKSCWGRPGATEGGETQ